MNEEKKQFDLEERTAKFGENAIDFCKNISQSAITKPLVSQLIRSATSIGANYMEANGANSRKDFLFKIYLCKKEAQETTHWLRMLAHASTELDSFQLLQKEARELTLIFGKIISTTKKNA